MGLPYLPWSEHTTIDSDDSNCTIAYYYNEQTEETTWDEPTEYKVWVGGAIDKFLKTCKSSWRRYVSQYDSKDYYFDKSTQVTQWDLPNIVITFKEDLFKWVAVSRKRAHAATSSSGGGSSGDVNDEYERSAKRSKLSVEEEELQQSSKKLQRAAEMPSGAAGAETSTLSTPSIVSAARSASGTARLFPLKERRCS